jgi:hypothetical protein
VTTVIQSGTSFVNRRMRLMMAAFGFTFALVLLGATAGAHGVGGKVSVAVLALALLLIGIRSVLSNSLDVGQKQLQIKSMLRTRSLAYGDLSSAEAITRPVGMYRRVCVRLEFISGSHLDITAVNESGTNQAIIEQAADLINQRITKAHPAPSP